MKLFLRILLGLVILVVVVIIALLSYVKIALPKVADAPDLSIEITPERLERGEYLALYVSGCIECHSTRDYNIFSGPVVEGTEGGGGHAFTHEMGLPGTYVPSNLTPFGLKEWTDGEIFRAVTSGVDREGKALFPVMPYHYYGKMDKEDIYSIIAYIRTLDPIESDLPDSESDFPMNFIINMMPVQAEFTNLLFNMKKRISFVLRTSFEITPKATSTNLGDAVLLASDMLGNKKGVVTVVSDFIATEGSDLIMAKRSLASKGNTVNFIDVNNEAENIAITDLIVDKEETTVEIKNYKEEDVSVQVNLVKGNSKISEETIKLLANSKEKIIFDTLEGISKISCRLITPVIVLSGNIVLLTMTHTPPG